MRLGLVGLPLSGKTTVFNALTGAHGTTGAHGDGHAHIATVSVPDERLDVLGKIFEPKKIVHATIEYLDVPGVSPKLDRSSVTRSLTTLRQVDALIHVVRCFENASAPHPYGSLDPKRDAAELDGELIVLVAGREAGVAGSNAR